MTSPSRCCQELLREETLDSGGRRATTGRSQPDGRRSSLSENARKQRKRKSDAAKDKVRRRGYVGIMDRERKYIRSLHFFFFFC